MGLVCQEWETLVSLIGDKGWHGDCVIGGIGWHGECMLVG